MVVCPVNEGYIPSVLSADGLFPLSGKVSKFLPKPSVVNKKRVPLHPYSQEPANTKGLIYCKQEANLHDKLHAVDC